MGSAQHVQARQTRCSGTAKSPFSGPGETPAPDGIELDRSTEAPSDPRLQTPALPLARRVPATRPAPERPSIANSFSGLPPLASFCRLTLTLSLSLSRSTPPPRPPKSSHPQHHTDHTLPNQTQAIMPRQRSVGRAPSRPTAPAPAAPQQHRPATTMAAPQQHHAPPQQQMAPPVQQSAGPGLFGQMASTAA